MRNLFEEIRSKVEKTKIIIVIHNLKHFENYVNKKIKAREIFLKNYEDIYCSLSSDERENVDNNARSFINIKEFKRMEYFITHFYFPINFYYFFYEKRGR